MRLQRQEYNYSFWPHNIPVAAAPNTGPQIIPQDFVPSQLAGTIMWKSPQSMSCSTVLLIQTQERTWFHYADCRSLTNPVAASIVAAILECNSSEKIMQFILDCSPLPEVILFAQQFGENIYCDLFYASRNWCFAIHREHYKRLGKWNFRQYTLPLVLGPEDPQQKFPPRGRVLSTSNNVFKVNFF